MGDARDADRPEAAPGSSTLTPEQWQRVDDLFALAFEQPESERAAFLDRECDDPLIRAEVASLLGSTLDSDARLHGAVAAVASTMGANFAARQIGRRIGPYRLVEQLGEGGMGVVYGAKRDDAEFERAVAIKILQHGLGSAAAIARFRDERQILAGLQHPGIVRLLDGGTTEDGLPYLVMERVDGVAITRFARDLSVRAKIELVIRVCAALQYAHGRLVVHRDIKPSNILVGVDGVPKLLDFGIAKLLDPVAERESKTGTGVALLTPAYASPEQALGKAISIATDVYSVGAVLYELLTAKLPLRVDGSPLEVLRAISEIDPPLPSSVGSKRELAGDLDNIVMKALAKDPTRRYASIQQLADDLQRFLDGEPVTARTATFGYRAGKFVRRHRGKLAIALLAVTALATATVISIEQARRADAEAGRATENALRAEASSSRAENHLTALYEEQGRTALLGGRAAEAFAYLTEAYARGADTPALRWMLASAAQPLEARLATLDARAGKVWWVEMSPDGATIVTAHEDGNARTWDASTGTLRATFGGHAADCGHARFSPDGARIVTVSHDGTGKVWGLDGRPIATLAGHTGYVLVAAFSPDGTRIVTAGGDGTPRIWDANTGALLHRLAGHTRDVRTIAFSRDGSRIVSGSADTSAKIWETSTGRLVATLEGHTGYISGVVAGGNIVATSSWDKTARLWTLDGKLLHVLSGHTDKIEAIELSRDDAFVVTGGHDRSARIWSTKTGQPTSVLLGHGAIIPSVTFSPDGKRVLTGAFDGSARVWNAGNGTTFAALDGHAVTTWRAAFSPDGTRAVTGSWDGRAKLWNVGRPTRVTIVAHVGPIHAAVLDATRKRVATGGDDGFARVWDLATGTLELETQRHEGGVYTVDVAGDLLAVSGADGIVRIWSLARRALHATCAQNAGPVSHVRFSPDGTRLATTAGKGVVRLWSTGCEKIAEIKTGHELERLVFAPDGARLVGIGPGDKGHVWDARTLAPVAELVGHTSWINDLVFSPDGSTVATASQDQTVRLWDGRTFAAKAVLRGHRGRVKAVRFGADPRWLATTSENGDAKLWDATTGTERATLAGHGNVVWGVEQSPDEQVIATVAADHRTRLWDATTFRLIGVLEGHAAPVDRVMFASETRLVTGGQDGILNIWALDRESRSAEDLVRVRCRAQLGIADGRLVQSETMTCN